MLCYKRFAPQQIWSLSTLGRSEFKLYTKSKFQPTYQKSIFLNQCPHMYVCIYIYIYRLHVFKGPSKVSLCKRAIIVFSFWPSLRIPKSLVYLTTHSAWRRMRSIMATTFKNGWLGGKWWDDDLPNRNPTWAQFFGRVWAANYQWMGSTYWIFSCYWPTSSFPI